MFSQRERKKNACHGLFLVTPESDLGAICVFGMRRKRSGQPELVSGTLAGRMPAPGRSGRARLTGRERAGYGGLMGRKGREETRGDVSSTKSSPVCADYAKIGTLAAFGEIMGHPPPPRIPSPALPCALTPHRPTGTSPFVPPAVGGQNETGQSSRRLFLRHRRRAHGRNCRHNLPSNHSYLHLARTGDG
jgi:hypothetical protein